MFWIFCLLTAAVVSELVVGYRRFWLARRPIVCFSLASSILASVFLLTLTPGAASLSLAAITVYSSFNLGRVLADRIDVQNLMPAISLTAIWLSSAKVLISYWLILASFWYLPPVVPVAALAIAQLMLAILMTLSVRRQMRTTTPLRKATQLSEKQWPSVTVSVPARNEGGQLEACLTTILASDYRKLEVLALDDDSQDRTADIIRDFAHAGVRFIAGPKVANNWLPKNQAYAALAAESSGEYLLFCGSDVRLSPHAIRDIVATMAEKHKTMMAIVPQNTIVHRLPAIQAMRYFWELAPPRRLFRRPPVLSSCWIIDRKTFDNAGGFEAVQRSVTPEAFFAHYAMTHDDGYSFVRSDAALGVTSEKPADRQRETMLYNRYPQLHRRPEMVLLLTAAELLILLGPVAVGLAVLAVHLSLVWLAVSVVALAIDIYAFGRVQRPIFPNVQLARLYGGYFKSVISDIYYLNRSMYRYEYGAVVYRGRDVSAQVRDKDRKG